MLHAFIPDCNLEGQHEHIDIALEESHQHPIPADSHTHTHASTPSSDHSHSHTHHHHTDNKTEHHHNPTSDLMHSLSHLLDGMLHFSTDIDELTFVAQNNNHSEAKPIHIAVYQLLSNSEFYKPQNEHITQFPYLPKSSIHLHSALPSRGPPQA